MQIISLYIDGFGKIKNTSLKFNGDFNEFCYGNAFGKTTIATFIKAMFYGLPSYKINSKDFPERKHFYPLNGGNFGGNIIFEKNGNEYRIERIFDIQSDVKDSVIVYKNNVQTNEFGQDVGKNIFGVDYETFEKLLFITTNDIEIKSNSSINEKLNNFSEITDGVNLSVALKKLDEKKKYYKQDRGNKGKIDELVLKIKKLEDEIFNINAIENSLNASYDELNNINSKLIELEHEKEKSLKAELINKSWEMYELKLNELNSLKAKLNEIISDYPKGLPCANESEQALSLLKQREKLELTISSYEKLKNVNSNIFDNKNTEDELTALKKDIDIFTKKTNELNNIIDSENNAIQVFKNGVPSSKELENVKKAIRNEGANNKNFKGKTLLICLNAVLTTLVLLGIVLLFFNRKLATLFIPVSGVLELLASITLFILTRTKATKTSNYKFVNDYFLSFGILGDDNYKRYDILVENINNYNDAIHNKNKELKEYLSYTISTWEDKIKKTFIRYGVVSGDYCNAYENLIIEYKSYLHDIQKQQSAESIISEAKNELIGVENKLNVYYDTYEICLTEKDITAAITDYITYEQTLTDISNAELSANKYKQENSLTEKPSVNKTVGELEKEINALKTEQARLNNIIDDAESRVIRRDDLSVELDNLRGEKATAEQTYKDYLKVIESINIADSNLNEKYVKPIEELFKKNLSCLDVSLEKSSVMKKNFEVSFDKSGVLSSVDYLSAGQKAVVALCFRLAIIEKLFDDMPFIVLDDPFTCLDEEHLSAVRGKIRLLPNVQTIYFTCHKSRSFM